MKINSDGIYLYKGELKALLTFAASKKDSHLAVVHFQADKDAVWARSTDGHRAIQAKGLAEGEGAPEGEWSVTRPYLEDCYKILTNDDVLVLRVSGRSLHTASIYNGETLEERSAVESAHDVAEIQTTFPIDSLDVAIQLPTNSRRPRCASVMAKYLSDLHVVAGAAVDRIDLYLGKQASDGLYFCSDAIDTTWLGRIMGMTEAQSETEDGEDNRQADLPGTEADQGPPQDEALPHEGEPS